MLFKAIIFQIAINSIFFLFHVVSLDILDFMLTVRRINYNLKFRCSDSGKLAEYLMTYGFTFKHLNFDFSIMRKICKYREGRNLLSFGNVFAYHKST